VSWYFFFFWRSNKQHVGPKSEFPKHVVVFEAPKQPHPQRGGGSASSSVAAAGTVAGAAASSPLHAWDCVSLFATSVRLHAAADAP
jgi:hypothetical protein